MTINKATCLAAVFSLSVLAGCVEISQILSPAPPAEEEIDWTQFGISNQANDADTTGVDDTDTNGTTDTDTNGDTVDDGTDTGPSVPTDTDTNGTDDTTTNGTDDTTTNGTDDADTNGTDTNGIPTLPDDAEIITTSSGLQYYDFEVGTGEQPPDMTASVRVAYTGYLPDGTIFDSNDDATFSLSGVVAGFGEGVASMKVGGKRRLIIPPDLGYGESGNSRAGIGGEDTIVFDVTLLEVVSQ